MATTYHIALNCICNDQDFVHAIWMKDSNSLFFLGYPYLKLNKGQDGHLKLSYISEYNPTLRTEYDFQLQNKSLTIIRKKKNYELGESDINYLIEDIQPKPGENLEELARHYKILTYYGYRYEAALISKLEELIPGLDEARQAYEKILDNLQSSKCLYKDSWIGLTSKGVNKLNLMKQESGVYKLELVKECPEFSDEMGGWDFMNNTNWLGHYELDEPRMFADVSELAPNIITMLASQDLETDFIRKIQKFGVEKVLKSIHEKLKTFDPNLPTTIEMFLTAYEKYQQAAREKNQNEDPPDEFEQKLTDLMESLMKLMPEEKLEDPEEDAELNKEENNL